MHKREELAAGRLLATASKSRGQKRLQEIVNQYPHTDAAIKALQQMAAVGSK